MQTNSAEETNGWLRRLLMMVFVLWIVSEIVSSWLEVSGTVLLKALCDPAQSKEKCLEERESEIEAQVQNEVVRIQHRVEQIESFGLPKALSFNIIVTNKSTLIDKDGKEIKYFISCSGKLLAPDEEHEIKSAVSLRRLIEDPAIVQDSLGGCLTQLAVYISEGEPREISSLNPKLDYRLEVTASNKSWIFVASWLFLFGAWSVFTESLRVIQRGTKHITAELNIKNTEK